MINDNMIDNMIYEILDSPEMRNLASFYSFFEVFDHYRTWIADKNLRAPVKRVAQDEQDFKTILSRELKRIEAKDSRTSRKFLADRVEAFLKIEQQRPFEFRELSIPLQETAEMFLAWLNRWPESGKNKGIENAVNFTGERNNYLPEIPIEAVIDHFTIMTEKKSKNGAPFLTKDQLTSFVKRAFGRDSQEPKQTINFQRGEKGHTIKRFYEFFVLGVREFECKNDKEPFMDLVYDNFTNFDREKNKIESFFKPGKVKTEW